MDVDEEGPRCNSRSLNCSSLWNSNNHHQNMASFRRVVINVQRILSSSTAHNRNSITPSPSLLLYRPQYGWLSNYSSDTAQSLDIDFSNHESKRRLFNRLLYRSKQRGFLELDLVLGRWVQDNIHSMDQNGIKALVDVLDLENPELWKWLTGQEQPPEAVKNNPVFSAVCDKVMNNLNSHASPETRATPGQPWVRGWDDFKKGRDSPITGNQ